MGFKRIKYPDGQISALWDGELTAVDRVVRERINNYEDLMYVKAISEILQNIGNYTWKLFIPCLFGQRSDRRFDAKQSFDLKIIAEVINSCKFHSVEIFDPHSDVALAMIDKSVKKTSFEYVNLAVADLYKPETGINSCNFTLVSPDAGAYKKVFDYGEKLNLNVVAAVKHRDEEGKIDLTFMGDVKDKHCLIVDDLCDGGRTFIELGKKLKEQGAQKVYLYVSHGLFSNGFEKLMETLDGIYCTNSHHDIDTKGDWYWNKNNFLTQYNLL